MDAKKYTTKNFENGEEIIINKSSFKVIADLKSHWLIKGLTGQFCYKKY